MIAKGFEIPEKFLRLVDSQSGPAIVVGSGGTLEEIYAQVATVLFKFSDAKIFACNDIGLYLPVVDYYVSLHSNKLELWSKLRKLSNKREFVTHGWTNSEGVDYIWRSLMPVMSLSGYFAAQLAYILGCDPIVLVGCPGDRTPRFFDQKGRTAYEQPSLRDQIRNETERVPDWKRRVRSMSGWTREVFGGI